MRWQLIVHGRKLGMVQILPKVHSCTFGDSNQNKSGTTHNSQYPAALRSAQIDPFGRNFGYSWNIIGNIWQEILVKGFETFVSRKEVYEIF